MPYGDPSDPEYRRLKYVRYTDDALLGFVGPKSEAREIKWQIGNFLWEMLQLEMSKEKTLITNATEEHARFLGYEVSMAKADSQMCGKRRSINGVPILKVPSEVARE